MKTVFKVFGKVIKWYAIADVIFLALMGVSNICGVVDEYPEIGPFDAANEAWARSVNTVRRFYKI